MEGLNEGDLKALFSLYCDDAFDEFEKAKDRINSQFSLASRYQSGAHTNALLEGAESALKAAIKAVCAKVTERKIFDVLRSHVDLAFDQCLGEIREIVVGRNGLKPAPGMAEVVHRLGQQSRSRIHREIAKCELELLAGGNASLEDLIGALPPHAKTRNRDCKAVADLAARMIRDKDMNRAEAFRQALQEKGCPRPGTLESNERAVRETFDMMYDTAGHPLQN
ncbi:hypothetical protein [Croceicoccus bisphenolivorans]|uniref:hypothetical protein n=1 Tax=Croceicoccus bisphenolivorans TaxID=1783232 RepID=UPI0008346617|nr:hypothetical protein [Croceicoccus bisphenolivorans]